MKTIRRNVAIAFLAILFLYAISKSVQKLMNVQIATSSRDTLVTKFKFPAITVCNYDYRWASNDIPIADSFSDILSPGGTGTAFTAPTLWVKLISHKYAVT